MTAHVGPDALRDLLKDDFAVILLDVFMPGMDGYETAGPDPERQQTARIPIIFLSAVNKETEHLMRGYAMGAVDYVFKPVDPIMLQSKVNVFVDLYQMRPRSRKSASANRNCSTATSSANSEKLLVERELRAPSSARRPSSIRCRSSLPRARELGRRGAVVRRRRSGAGDRLCEPDIADRRTSGEPDSSRRPDRVCRDSSAIEPAPGARDRLSLALGRWPLSSFPRPGDAVRWTARMLRSRLPGRSSTSPSGSELEEPACSRPEDGSDRPADWRDRA